MNYSKQAICYATASVLLCFVVPCVLVIVCRAIGSSILGDIGGLFGVIFGAAAGSGIGIALAFWVLDTFDDFE